MWAIMVTAAGTLHVNGQVNMRTAEQAAKALEPLVKSFPYAGDITDDLCIRYNWYWIISYYCSCGAVYLRVSRYIYIYIDGKKVQPRSSNRLNHFIL